MNKFLNSINNTLNESLNGSSRRDDNHHQSSSDFAPPAGPPPGWQPNHRPTNSHSSGYAPPPQQPPRPSGDYNSGYGRHGNYQNQNAYGPPGGSSYGGYYNGPPQHQHQQQQQHYGAPPPNYQQHQQQQHQQYLQPQNQDGHHHSRPTTPNSLASATNMVMPSTLPLTKVPGTMYPRDMYMWWTSDKDLGTYIKMGPEIRGEGHFVVKLHMSKLKIDFRPGSSFNKEKREEIAIAEGSSMSGSSYKITKLNGQTCKIPIEKKVESPAGMPGTWQWRKSDGFLSKVTNKIAGKAKAYHFSDQDEGGTIVAKFNGEIDIAGNANVSSKKVLGHFQFLEPVAMSRQPQEFATIVLMSFFRVQQKFAESQMAKSVLKGVVKGGA